jgi:hypothetical protein
MPNPRHYYKHKYFILKINANLPGLRGIVMAGAKLSR